MDIANMRFNSIDKDKLSVCFTWDDNFLAHSRLITPEFKKRDMRCTFYINPGEPGFEEKYLPLYRALSEAGFEIGSHGYLHDNYSNLYHDVLERELEKAALSIEKLIGVYPATFAFPYHDYNEETLAAAKARHLETRNTLADSLRFAIKADSRLDEMIMFVNGCVSDGRSMVFSGHSAIPADKACIGAEDFGYGPVLIGCLSSLLDHVLALKDKAEVLTFEQTALKRYIMDKCPVSEGSFTIGKKQLDKLKTLGIDVQRLSLLI